MHDILGPYRQIIADVPLEYADITNGPGAKHDTWPYIYLHTFAEAIYAGSSEIRQNIIVERVLSSRKRCERIRSLASIGRGWLCTAMTGP